MTETAAYGRFFDGSERMLRHYITKYIEDGKRYAEAWIQLDIFGLSWCFSRRRIELAD